MSQKLTVGFARFVLKCGMETIAPQIEGKPKERWIDVGRRLYGRECFDSLLRTELAERRTARAQK